MRSPHTAMKSSPRLPQLEKARAQQQRPNAAKNKRIKKKKKKKKKETLNADIWAFMPFAFNLSNSKRKWVISRRVSLFQCSQLGPFLSSSPHSGYSAMSRDVCGCHDCVEEGEMYYWLLVCKCKGCR